LVTEEMGINRQKDFKCSNEEQAIKHGVLSERERFTGRPQEGGAGHLEQIIKEIPGKRGEIRDE